MSKNVYDYIEYYKDSTFDEVPFNVIDGVVFSIMAYYPIKEEVNEVSFRILDIFLNKDNIKGAVPPIAVEMIDKIKDTKRYKDLRISNMKQIENEKIQFGGMTIRDNNGNAYVVYEGTNSSIIGWLQNFMLTVIYPTDTQKEAIDYINKNVERTDKKVYVLGHSKGGNLALVSSMECDEEIRNKIEKIYNYDGPGIRKEELESDKYKAIKDRLTNFLPDGSLVGVMMFNDNYEYISADGPGFKEHYPTSWHVFGGFFEKEDSLKKGSEKVKENLEKSVEELKKDEVISTVDTLSKFFTENNIVNLRDLKDKTFDEVKNMSESFKEIDKADKDLFMNIIKILINPDSIGE